ncbi:CHAD domain-containing protein [Methanosarcina sp. MSH10X1]|uniref:CYTH and CHAD domain-containing protein n=1 Tax=Methanosarcina sp. MSH10X1 TaxID=2507075 RepID=UPI000FFC04C8|nr:CHAD domain-containing protein [Methanosarcina sp. MSH10X1]RXA21194.1 CHAD domain-containing protein [Methanosarcina sp. MSH10X1]
MEIESKFLVTEEVDFQALESLSELASYALSGAKIQLNEDIFFDTENRAIMASGYYLRVRKSHGEEGSWVTVKSLGGFEGGTHRREEYVSFLPEGKSVLECPDPRIRDLIFELTAGLDLFPLLSLKQKRMIRQVKMGERLVAETYLDRVNLKSGGREKHYNEFEIELKSEGSQEDLEIMRVFLLRHYNLAESHFSKFERAYLFMEKLPENTFLSLRERAFCAQLASQKNMYGKQAQILIGLDRGQTCEELSQLLKVPQTGIKALRSKFKEKRLSIFPFTTYKEKDCEFHLLVGKNHILKKGKKEAGFKRWDPESLLEYYEANTNRAEKTREYALTLFDELFIFHGMGQEERKLLGLAALLKDTGNFIFPEESNRMSREILLTHSIKGLRLHETLMLALITELHDPYVNEKGVISIFKGLNTRLPPGLQNKALMLAAITSIADLFEASGTRPGKIKQLEDALEIEIIGALNEKAAKKFETKSKLWKTLSESKLLFSRAEEEKDLTEDKSEINEAGIKKQAGKDKKPEKKQAGEEKKREEKKAEREEKIEKKNFRQRKEVTVRPADSMAGLACRILSYQFSSMLSHERGTVKGEEIEELHDMRVAVRRMRAATKIFEAYLDSRQLEPYLKGLKITLGSLGEVRDLDVFREKAEKYLKTLPTGHEHDLDSLFAMLTLEREEARKDMLAYLDSEKYQAFKREFSDVLASPENLGLPAINRKHDALPHRVREVLPSILYARLADINAYSEWVDGPYLPVERLHRLRIAAKGMRYTLEFFESVLGEDAKVLVKELKTLQEHLGDMHDAVIAVDRLGSYLKTGEWGSAGSEKASEKKKFPTGAEGIEAYLAYREEELQTLLNTFPEAWERIRNRNFRERIESAIKNLY